MMMWMWTSLLSSLAFAQPLLNEVGEDGVPEMLRAGPELPEITTDAAFDPFAPLQVVGGTVTEIQFEGQDYIDEFVLRSAMRLSEGDEMDSAKIRQSIEAIHATGYFADIRVEGFRQSTLAQPNGVRVLVTVKEKPVIRSVSIKGNKKLDDEVLEEKLTIDDSDIINYTKIQKNIQRLREAYIEKGYYLVEIEPVVKEISDDAVELTFQIVENRKVW